MATCPRLADAGTCWVPPVSLSRGTRPACKPYGEGAPTFGEARHVSADRYLDRAIVGVSPDATLRLLQTLLEAAARLKCAAGGYGGSADIIRPLSCSQRLRLPSDPRLRSRWPRPGTREHPAVGMRQLSAPPPPSRGSRSNPDRLGTLAGSAAKKHDAPHTTRKSPGPHGPGLPTLPAPPEGGTALHRINTCRRSCC